MLKLSLESTEIVMLAEAVGGAPSSREGRGSHARCGSVLFFIVTIVRGNGSNVASSHQLVLTNNKTKARCRRAVG